jgi:hypothetical protein
MKFFKTEEFKVVLFWAITIGFSILLVWLLGGCTNQKLHPNNTPYSFQIQNADRILIESSKVPAVDKTGNVVRDAAGNVVLVSDRETVKTINQDGSITESSKPLLAAVNVKDQTMKAPMTAIDLASQLISYTPMGIVGYSTYKLGQKAIDAAGKDPVIVEKTNNNPIIIDGDDGVIYPKD